jgi:hypothetical protein
MKTNETDVAGRHTLLTLTKHAQTRLHERQLSEDAISSALTYGRHVRVRGAHVYALGRKEVERYSTDGVNLQRFRGVQVVCSPDGAVLTVYRSYDLSGLRPRSGLRHHRRNHVRRAR